jgi:hypothetical protein
VSNLGPSLSPYAPNVLEVVFSEVGIAPLLCGRISYVEYRRILPCLHKTLIIPVRIMSPHRLGSRTGAVGQNELLHNGVLRSSPRIHRGFIALSLNAN